MLLFSGLILYFEVKRSEDEITSLRILAMNWPETNQRQYPESFSVEVESNEETYNFEFKMVQTEKGNMPIKM